MLCALRSQISDCPNILMVSSDVLGGDVLTPLNRVNYRR
jgi:hypothetical protein